MTMYEIILLIQSMKPVIYSVFCLIAMICMVALCQIDNVDDDE